MKSFLLAGLLGLIQFTPDTLNAAPEVAPILKGQVDLLNELTERRRVNTFFSNEQSIFHGVQKGFVNVGTGNLTFVRRDLATVGRIPVVFARVYDSRYSGASDFSPGWRLSLAEIIEELPDGTLVYTDDSLTQTRFAPIGSGYAITPAQPSDIRAVALTNSDTLKVDYRNQWQKTFKRHGEGYRLKKVKDNNGNSLALKYQNGQLASIAGQNGRFVAITRHPSGQITQVMDDQGRTVNYHYNTQGQLSKVIDLGGNAWTYRYTEDGQLRQVKDPRGHEALNVTYDDDQVTRTRIRGAKYRYTYDDETTTVKDEAGNKSTFTQNEDGITIKVKNAEGFVSKIQLDENNQVTQLKHNGQKRGTFTYDDFGNPARMVRYDQEGLVELTYLFDWEDRVVEIEGTDGTTQTLSYDEKGNLLSQSENGQAIQYRYNTDGDWTSQTLDGETIEYRHNADGLLTRITQNGSITRFRYNATGRLDRITFPNGNRHTYQYDALGFRTRTERSDGSHMNYQYDSAGNMIENDGQHADGDTYGERFTLDAENRVSRMDFPENQGLDITYDDKGNPITLDWGDRTMSCEYDPEGRLTKVTDSEKGTSEYTYQPGEADIRRQLDDRTAGTQSNQRKASATLQALNNTSYTRPGGTPWPVLTLDSNLAVMDLPTNIGLVDPGAIQQSANQRRRLYNATAFDDITQRRFDKASNSFFLPAEYAAVNCALGCFLGSITLNIPSTVNAGSSFTIVAAASNIGPTCEAITYDWYINGAYVPGGANGTLTTILTALGTVDIVGQAEGACDQCTSIVADTVQSNCNDTNYNHHRNDPTEKFNNNDQWVDNIGKAVNPSNNDVRIIGTIKARVYDFPNHTGTFEPTAQELDNVVAGIDEFWGLDNYEYACSAYRYKSDLTISSLHNAGSTLSDYLLVGKGGVPVIYSAIAGTGGRTIRIGEFEGIWTGDEEEVVGHEFGHNLGFRHNDNTTSDIMYPVYVTSGDVHGYHARILSEDY